MVWASKTFSIEQSDPRIPLKKSTFSTGSIARSKKMGSKRQFFDCIRMPHLISDRKSPFSIHRSDCIRIGLTKQNRRRRRRTAKQNSKTPAANVNKRLLRTSIVFFFFFCSLRTPKNALTIIRRMRKSALCFFFGLPTHGE